MISPIGNRRRAEFRDRKHRGRRWVLTSADRGWTRGSAVSPAGRFSDLAPSPIIPAPPKHRLPPRRKAGGCLLPHRMSRLFHSQGRIRTPGQCRSGAIHPSLCIPQRPGTSHACSRACPDPAAALPRQRANCLATTGAGFPGLRLRLARQARRAALNRLPYPPGTSSVITSNCASQAVPKEVEIATSVASLPRAIRMRPMRGLLWRASKVCQRPPR